CFAGPREVLRGSLLVKVVRDRQSFTDLSANPSEIIVSRREKRLAILVRRVILKLQSTRVTGVQLGPAVRAWFAWFIGAVVEVVRWDGRSYLDHRRVQRIKKPDQLQKSIRLVDW